MPYALPHTLASLHRVAVGSTNAVKIAATRAVVAQLAPSAVVNGLAVPSTALAPFLAPEHWREEG